MGSKMLTLGRARAGKGKGRAGFTLVEIGLAMTILMVALMAMSASTLQTHNLRRQNRERAVAQNAMRLISEQVHALADEIRRTGGNWSQDLMQELSPGGALGNTFAIEGLTPAPGEASVGTITVIVDETQTDAMLNLELGLPRDFNGDGVADNPDVTGTANILPILVVARWNGVSGDVRIRHPFFVIGY
jgi:type II secretory pathway pseudopilin PulG